MMKYSSVKVENSDIEDDAVETVDETTEEMAYKSSIFLKLPKNLWIFYRSIQGRNSRPMKSYHWP